MEIPSEPWAVGWRRWNTHLHFSISKAMLLLSIPKDRTEALLWRARGGCLLWVRLVQRINGRGGLWNMSWLWEGCVGQPHSSLHRHGHLEVPSQLPPISTEPTHRSIGRCGEMCQGDHRLAIPVGGFKGSGVAFNRWRIGRDDGYPGKKCTD